jgi:hypothetical protein
VSACPACGAAIGEPGICACCSKNVRSVAVVTRVLPRVREPAVACHCQHNNMFWDMALANWRCADCRTVFPS